MSTYLKYFETVNVNSLYDTCPLCYIQTFKQELSGTRAYKEKSADETSVLHVHRSHLPIIFSVNVKDR